MIVEQTGGGPNSHVTPERNMIILVTGVMAVGKSTVAQALAEQFERSVHLRGDVFRRLIVNGRADMGAPDQDEALRQLKLRYRSAAQAAMGYHEAGFTVIYQDVILGSLLTEVVSLLADTPLEVIVLRADEETIRARESSRQKTGYGNVTIEDLQDALDSTPKVGHWIDSSNLSVEETVVSVLEAIDENSGAKRV